VCENKASPQIIPVRKKTNIRKNNLVLMLKGRGKKLISTISRLFTMKVIKQIRTMARNIDFAMPNVDLKIFFSMIL
jgi:hypothetical protein